MSHVENWTYQFAFSPDEDVSLGGDDKRMSFVHLLDGVVVERVDEEGRPVPVLLKTIGAQRPRAVRRVGLLCEMNTKSQYLTSEELQGDPSGQ